MIRRIIYSGRGRIQQSSKCQFKWLIFPLAIIVLGLVFILLTGLDYPFRGDEEHFISTIELFGDNYGAALDYPEVTGPLFYYLYSSWGRLIGFSPSSLRIFNLLVSVSALILIYTLYGKVLGSLKIVLPGIILLLLNPYYPGLSMHVFTDIPALLFIILAALAVRIRNPLLLFISTACALLIRQYSVFVVLSAAVYLLVLYRKNGHFRKGEFIALIGGAVPLLVMMLLWGGIAPPSGINQWVLDDGSIYRIGYIYTYVIFMTISSIPLLIIARRTLFQIKNAILPGFLASLTYFFFPVRASFVTQEQTGLSSVGLIHGFIQGLLNNYVLEQLVFWILSCAGFISLFSIVRLDMKAMKAGKWDFRHFLTISVIFFLIIMPFSYQVWEKYLIVILPFLQLRLLMMIDPGLKYCHPQEK